MFIHSILCALYYSFTILHMHTKYILFLQGVTTELYVWIVYWVIRILIFTHVRIPGSTLYFCILYVFTHYLIVFTLFVSLSLSSYQFVLVCWMHCDMFQLLIFNMFTLYLSFTSTYLPWIVLTYNLQYVPHAHSLEYVRQYLNICITHILGPWLSLITFH